MIDVAGLRYRYHGADRPALDDVSFHVRPGEVFGFLGPSGAGKSTTQKVLIRLLAGYEGRVHVLGRDVREWNSDLYTRIGVAFEHPTYFRKLTGLENLRYFAALQPRATEEPAALLEEVGLAADADKRVAFYSKGMGVRLGVARALLHRPELLFLDEPTAGLDPVSSRRIRALIRRRREQGTTVFLTTHDMAVADELCDRVAFLVDGRIAALDSPRALRLAHGVRTVRVEHGSDGRAQVRDFPLDGLADDAAFLSLLRAGAVQTLHTQEPTLEEVFVRVTGRALA